MSIDLESKHEALKAILRDLGSVVVAFSAGADSTLVLQVAVDTLGADKVVAATGRSASLATSDLEESRELASQMGVRHILVDTDEFDNSDYLKNPTNRCFFCKSTLYEHLKPLLAKEGMGTIISGTNADDLGDYRPGLTAAADHGVRAPLAEAGFTKDDVRALSAQLGLVTADKPPHPCLSSRVPYGDAITPEKLRMIEAGEMFLQDLGIAQCRVRHHGNHARIEVPAEHFTRIASPECAAAISKHFHSLGFQFVSLDLDGFRSGRLNELITITSTPHARPSERLSIARD